jgi:steroid delta-isomerase-like uncharacterized protein
MNRRTYAFVAGIVAVTGCLLAAAAPRASADETTDANKTAFTRFVTEVMNKGDMAVADELLAPDFVEHEEMPPGMPGGRDGCKQFFVMFRKAFPDLKVTIDDMIAEGDKVVLRATWHGTNTGEFMGMPATGKTVDYQAIDIVRMKDGKAVEHWGVDDRLGMMQQMHPDMMKMGMGNGMDMGMPKKDKP